MPAGLTPEQVTSAQAALASVEGYIEVSENAYAYPAGKDWTADVRTFAADPAAATTLDSLASLVKATVKQTVAPVYEHPTLLTIDEHRAVFEACKDFSATTLVDASGKSVLQPPADPRVVVTLTLRLYSAEQGGWLVAEDGVKKPASTC